MQKTIIIFALALSLLETVLGQCVVKSFDTKLVPACNGKDLYIKWPNHEDQTTFHQCTKPGNAQLVNCPAGQVFTYVQQACTTCASYVPPVECKLLPTDAPPTCVSFNGNGNELPVSTTNKPISSTVAPEENPEVTGTTTTTLPETTQEPEDLEESLETTEAEPPVTVVPGPPSPSPEDPNKPEPVPTPPTVNPTPPFVG